MAVAPTLHDYLSYRGVTYDLVAHPRTYSSHDSAVAAHVADDHVAKGVVLKDEAGYLEVVIPGGQWVKLHALRDELGRALEFAPESELDALFPDCASGAVPVAGQAYGIDTILDTALTSLANVYFEAGDHEHLVHLSGEGFATLMHGLRQGHFASSD